MKRKVDVVITGGGTLYLFHILTAAARQWVEENVSEERQFLGGALAVEHRFVLNLAQGMELDGLNVNVGR